MHTEIDSCEQYVLACMMHDSDALDVGCQKLQLDDFSNTSHRVIFDVIKKLHDINKIITVKAISEVINTTSELRFNNSEALIDQIYASFTNSLEFDINLEMIKNFKMKNLLVKLCEKTKTTDFNIINIDDKLFEHRDALDEIMARKSRSTMVSAADVIEQLKQ
jgi:replicative DNA helicase